MMIKKYVVLLFVTALMFAGCAKTEQPEVNKSGDKKTEQSEGNESGDKEEEIYVPKDLDDCFVQLKTILKPEDIEEMKNGTEDDMSQYHMGLGVWLRNNWGLWGDSRLAKWFNAQGINHPDDMSGIILRSFWRHLNGKPIKLEEQVKYYQDYWKKQKAIQEELTKRVPDPF